MAWELEPVYHNEWQTPHKIFSSILFGVSQHSLPKQILALFIKMVHCHYLHCIDLALSLTLGLVVTKTVISLITPRSLTNLSRPTSLLSTC